MHEARRLGLGAELFCNRSATRAVRGIPARPHFRVGGYANEPDATTERERELIERCNDRTLDDLERLGPQAPAPGDFVFFPAITANLVLGACRWIGGYEPARAPRFGLCLMFQRDWHPSGARTEVGADFYERAFAAMPPETRERVVFTCETDELADDYARLLGRRPLVLPVPTIQHLSDSPAPEAAPAPEVLCLGYSKPEKGTHLLPGRGRGGPCGRPAALRSWCS